MYEFLTPPNIFYGEGVLEESRNKLSTIGNKALVVTDKVMKDIGHIEKITTILENQGIDYSIYSKVNSEPKDWHIEEGVEIYQNQKCDFVIAVGGGSPIDAAKGIGAMITNPGHITDYMGLGKIKQPSPPVIAVPTTAGTGSEVTQFTIIADTKNDVKMLIGSKEIVPDVAIVDAKFTKSVPPKVTAATGIDALTHAIEAYTSVDHQPLADTLALSAIRKISKYLRRAWKDGSDMEAREKMMLAAMEAGMSFNNSSVTVVHGMSRPIGALFHIAHGVSNAILLPVCMNKALKGATARFADVAEAMGVDRSGLSDLEAAKEGVKEVSELCSDIEIPSKAVDLGINEDEFLANVDKMAKDALESGSPDNAIYEFSKQEIIELYKELL
ncbi:iron-containing alcohol dehydrogenase [Halanaerobaculum tunisiense]